MCIMNIEPAQGNRDTEYTPGAWFVWTRGNTAAQGSALPFDRCMRVVSDSIEELRKTHADAKRQYKSCKEVSDNLRVLLTDVFPAWTHRRTSTQALPDAREEFVYGLYCYARGGMYDAMVKQNVGTAVSRRTLAQAAHNAAHLRLVAAQLLWDEQVASDAHELAAASFKLLADHYEKQWDDENSGIGAACAFQSHAIKLMELANLDVAQEQLRLEQLRSRNTTYETEERCDRLALTI